MGDRGQVGLAWTGAVALILCAAAGCTTSGHVGRSSPAQPGGPGAGPQQSNPGSLTDQPVASTGCGRRAGIRAGTTAQPGRCGPASPRGRSESPRLLAARPARLFRLPPDAAGARVSWRRRNRARDGAHQRPVTRHRTGGGSWLPIRRVSAKDHGRAPPGWDASGPRDPFADGIDDGLYVSHMLNEIQASYCVDARRIWATGISNGGSMVGYLACVLADRIAAFATFGKKGSSSRFPVAATPVIRPRYWTCMSAPIRSLRTRASRPAVRRTTTLGHPGLAARLGKPGRLRRGP